MKNAFVANNLPSNKKIEKAMAPLKALYGDSWDRTFAPSFLKPAALLAQSGLPSLTDTLCAYFLFRYIALRSDKAPSHEFYLSDSARIATLENFRSEFGEKIFMEMSEMLTLAPGIPAVDETFIQAPVAAKRYSLALLCFLVPDWVDGTFNRSLAINMDTSTGGKEKPGIYMLQDLAELCDNAEALLRACQNKVNPFLEQRLARELTSARAQLTEAWKSYPPQKPKPGGPSGPASL